VGQREKLLLMEENYSQEEGSSRPETMSNYFCHVATQVCVHIGECASCVFMIKFAARYYHDNVVCVIFDIFIVIIKVSTELDLYCTISA